MSVLSNWLDAAATELARWRRTRVSPGQAILRQRLDGDDPFWWILAGGTDVPGFGAHAGKQPGTERPVPRKTRQ